MKQLRSRLTVVLVTISVACFAQTPEKAAAPAQVSQPVSPSRAPAASQQPAAAAPASGANRAGPLDPENYVIGAEDSLQITVWKEPTLSGTVPVRPDGMISMVLVGDLKAAGLTPMALSADIGQRLKKYIQDPVVTVVVLGVNSQRIFTVGEVNKVGPIMLTPGMTPLQAIVSAGGLTQFANSKHIYILRNVGGKQEKIPFDYKKALKGENQGVALIPGDTIVIP
jgi:polysaccharide export outer membrane protein